MTLLVSGWVAIDEIQTPFGQVSGQLGGSATGAALAASLFTDVRLLAAVGPDFPESERRKLEGRSIDLEGVVTVPGVTSRWGGKYHYDMNTRDTLYTELGVNADWEPTLPAGWNDSESAFLAAADPGLQRRLIDQLAPSAVTMVDTIKFFIDTVADEFRTTMGQSTFVSINESEARELAGTPSIAKAARVLLGLGADGIIVKLGEYGAAYSGDGWYFVAPGYPLEDVIDPTGAGDAFAGAFMGYIDAAGDMSPAHIRRGMIYASTVASFQVEDFGPARLLRLTREELDSRYREFKGLTHFEVD